MNLKYCIRSMRLRTLPLSLAGILMGIFIARFNGEININASIFLVLTAISLQILSNLSNELGDTLHGTDNANEREGMHYSIMDGGLTIEQMKRLIQWITDACIIFGMIMVKCAFGTLLSIKSAIFLLLGLFAIWAAKHYTMGKHPYGYIGLGDIFVLIFFGFATVIGGCYICGGAMAPYILLPALSVGLFSVGVLNVNNIRDMKTDMATRTTVAIMLGERASRIYQCVLIGLGFICMVLYFIALHLTIVHYLFLLTLPLYIIHLKGVFTRSGKALDKMLPLLVLSTLLFVLLCALGMFI